MSVRKMFLVVAAALWAASLITRPAAAQDSRAAVTPVDFTTEELDNLLAPVALYPDAILAQLLVAATFPDQVEFAARHVRARGTRDIDDQPWDVSVKAIAHYPPVLNMLADRPDWTTALGQAYAMQSSDVMESVQHLRELANAQGNLRSTAQQNVVVDGRYIRIEPAQPRVIYVPTYDPLVVYYRPIVHVGVYTGHWSFGIGFPIGAWLSYDCDWYGRRVYYTGWHANFGWRVVSYPYIRITPVYVHPRYEVVYVNRTVVHRYVNYDRLRNYNTVHRNVTYDRRRGGAPGPIQRDVVRRNDDRGGRDRIDGRNDGRNDGRTAGRNDVRTDGRDDARNDTRGVGPRVPDRDGRSGAVNPPDNRNDTRSNGRTVPDRGRVVAPPVMDDKRAQSRNDAREKADERRGGVVAPRTVEKPVRQSPPRTESPRQNNSDRRVVTPPSRASASPPRASSPRASSPPPRASAPRSAPSTRSASPRSSSNRAGPAPRQGGGGGSVAKGKRN